MTTRYISEEEEHREKGYYWIRSLSQPSPAFEGRWVVAEWDGGYWLVPGSDEGWSERVWELETGARVTRVADETAAEAVEIAATDKLSEAMTSIPRRVEELVRLVRENGLGWEARGDGFSFKVAMPKPAKKKARSR